MLHHYITSAFRFIKRHKAFTAINLTGLAFGITACYFALLYVNFELSYDTHHERANQIYRLITDVTTTSGVQHEGSTAPMAPAVGSTFVEVQKATRLMLDYMLVQRDRDLFGEEKMAYADPEVFDVFTIPLLAGDQQTCLRDPLSVVISESAAKKYFGNTDPLGQTLTLDRERPATITAVMRDMPQNTHLRTDFLLSMSTLLKVWNPSMEHNWRRFGANTYLLLNEDTDTEALSSRLTTFVQSHMPPGESTYNVSLEPLRDIYLHGEPRGHRTGSIETGQVTQIVFVTIVAGFVLLLACFNFINLTTAFSTHRTREVGVRKVMGASRGQLVFQFLLDSLVLSTAAFALGLMLCSALLPHFNTLAGKIMVSNMYDGYDYVLLLFGISMFAGIAAGAYPAFFISGFKPIASLKGKSMPSQGKLVRHALVVAQFMIAVVVITATIVTHLQLVYMQSRERGFDHSQKLIVDFYFKSDVPRSKDQFANIPGVDGITISSAIPGKNHHRMDTQIENADGHMQEQRVDAFFVDDQFFPQYDLQLVTGSLFSSQHRTDTARAMIVNETMVRSLGFHTADDVIGKRFAQAGSEGEIIGVVKDFHTTSFRETIQPLTFQQGGFPTFITFQIAPGHQSATILKIKERWSVLFDNLPFNYFFADDAYNAQYAREQRFEKLFLYFSVLVIVLSCLGLIGLSTFSIERRKGEIGIRKVLGSSSTGIVRLLLKESALLIVIACALAAPVAWAGVNSWLSEFAYRINPSWWIFAMAGVIVALIAFGTISYQTFLAASANPVKTLRSE